MRGPSGKARRATPDSWATRQREWRAARTAGTRGRRTGPGPARLQGNSIKCVDSPNVDVEANQRQSQAAGEPTRSRPREGVDGTAAPGPGCLSEEPAM